MKNCPVCKQEPQVTDFVSCQNKKCTEFNLEYLPYEWNDLIKDLEELELLEKD